MGPLEDTTDQDRIVMRFNDLIFEIDDQKKQCASNKTDMLYFIFHVPLVRAASIVYIFSIELLYIQ